MSFLEDLKKRMSTQGADRYSEERFAIAKPQIVEQETASQLTDAAPPILLNVEEEARKKRKKIYIISTTIVGVVIIAAITFWGIFAYRASYVVGQNNIDIQITSPERLPSGENIAIKFTVRNKSKVTWQNTSLDVQKPIGFAVNKTEPKQQGTGDNLQWGIGTLRPKETVSFEVSGRLVGKANSTANFVAVATLTPQNTPETKKQKKQFATVNVDESLIQISLIAPKQAANGEKIPIKVIYRNKKNSDVQGVRINVDPPAGFVLETSTPAITGTKLTWDLPSIPQLSEGEIDFVGTIQGDPDVVRAFKATLGFITDGGGFLYQNDVQSTTAMARRAITITQIFNNQQDSLKANPADTIEAKINVKNTGDIGLRDLIIKTSFTGTGLDPISVESSGGFYDSRLNTITWTASSIPGLKAMRPSDSIQLTYRFRLLPLQNLPFSSQEDKNFSVMAQTTADSPDIPSQIGTNKIISSGIFQIMLNSVMQVAMTAYYDDGRTGLPVSVGPQPPQVGKETIYTIRAKINNSSADVVDGVYRTVLPDGIRWVGNKYSTTGTVSFDERTREVVWKIDIIPARSGTGLPGPELNFQIGLTPSMNQIDSRPVLCLGSSLDGTDTFTSARLHTTGEAVNTEVASPDNSEVIR
jgi:hypothetical protein